MSNKAEALLKKLRRLDANSLCPNCHSPAPKGIGFGNVCAKFGTFVCDLCKTSHQAVSHRVKSVSMSTWTLEEVEALEYPRGGNEAATLLWLANAPAPGGKYNGRSQRPKQGDDILIYKQFVVDCYDLAMFKSSAPLPEQPTIRKEPATLRSNPATPAKQVAAEPSLLDFTSDVAVDAFGGFSSAPAPQQSVFSFGDSSQAETVDPFGNSKGRSSIDDVFGGFSSAPAAAPRQQQEDIFGSFATAPMASPQPQQKQPIDLDALLQPPTPGPSLPQPLPSTPSAMAMQYNPSPISAMMGPTNYPVMGRPPAAPMLAPLMQPMQPMPMHYGQPAPMSYGNPISNMMPQHPYPQHGYPGMAPRPMRGPNEQWQSPPNSGHHGSPSW